jgi:hypothetical protein
MEELIVRVYNVRFGDAIFISVPDEDENGKPVTRYILIDVGNAAAEEGGINEVFGPVVKDILSILDNNPIDLYVMTHEHMDHVQGLLWAAKNLFTEADLIKKLKIRHSWLTASSRPDYYDQHPEAKKKKDLASAAYLGIHDFKMAMGASANKQLDLLLKINNRFLSSDPLSLSSGKTSDCVDYLRKLAGNNTHYVYRSVGKQENGTSLCDIKGLHPFRKTQLEIWAPEEDSSEYYGAFTPMALGVTRKDGKLPQITNAVPPPGVDAGAFYNLIRYRQSSLYDNMLAIDKAANNTSIVFCLKWKGWKLLFPGDAEERSWKEMNKGNVLSPVDFLKISHHGSSNGTPDSELLKVIFPDPGKKKVKRFAALATYRETYGGIPDDATLNELKSLGCKIQSTLDIEDGKAMEFRFKARK